MRLLLSFGFLFSFSCLAQKLSPEDEIARRWIREGRAGAAAAFLDASVLVSELRSAEERVRLLLLSAVAHGESGTFETAYRRVREAEDLLESPGFLSRFGHNERARDRVRASLELVLHDIRGAQAQVLGEVPR